MKRIAIWLCTGVWLGGSLVGCGGDDACDLEAADTICTIAGSGVQGFTEQVGPATKAALYIPMDTAVSPDGEVWILDFNNYVVRAIGADGNLRTVLGSGELGDSPPPGVDRVPASEALFNHTSDLLFHDGYLYLAAWHNSRIKRVRLSDMTLENFAGRGIRTYYDGDGGPALAAALDLPAAMALDPNGNLAIMDQQNQVIRQVDSSGVIRTLVGRCIVDYEEPCTAGEQPVPCPDSDKLTCGDPAETCAIPCSPGFGGDGGPALEARMAQPFGGNASPGGRIAYDPAGNLLFADTDNHRIRKIDTAGVITTIAGTGVRGYAGDEGPATEAQLNDPADLAIAPDGTIYFADVYNDCVRKIDPSGTITRVAGQCGLPAADRGFAGDGGPPLEAKLDRPHGLDLVGHKLYVTDSYNNRIRVVNLGR
jgi:hypothetical protein